MSHRGGGKSGKWKKKKRGKEKMRPDFLFFLDGATAGTYLPSSVYKGFCRGCITKRVGGGRKGRKCMLAKARPSLP